MPLPLPLQRFDEWLWAIDESPPGSKMTDKDYYYAPDDLRDVTNHSLGNLAAEMKVVDQALKNNRLLTMGEMDTIMQAISVPKAVYDVEQGRLRGEGGGKVGAGQGARKPAAAVAAAGAGAGRSAFINAGGKPSSSSSSSSSSSLSLPSSSSSFSSSMDVEEADTGLGVALGADLSSAYLQAAFAVAAAPCGPRPKRK